MASSEFYTDLSKWEPTIAKGLLTRKQAVLIVKMLPGTLLSTSAFILIPGWYGWVLTAVLVAVLVVPFLLRFFDYDRTFKRSITFYLTEKKRTYQKIGKE
ncbi:hypothetical protein [Fructobacillus tropaeoli]|uniref:Glycoprotein n=1 Tax=Fructobacillus tropaeoli TaxID=709323 RepID=A0A3F3H3D0_9LACO|nr:hypothetical protein [Fructobacillus tropaeoli]GAP04984.1 glycoprotein [Fructobacillus tropaeoli]